MRTIRLIHASDFRLDAPFRGLSAEKAAIRLEEQSRMLDRLAELAGQVGAEVMLLSGDLLDGSWDESGEELMRGLRQVPCPVVIADREKPIWSRLKLPENVTIFRERGMHLVTIPSAGLRVYGAAYTDGMTLRGFHAERKSGFYNLLCMFGTDFTGEELAASGIDYAALGGRRTASGLMQSGSCRYSWPGCPEGRGFDECGQKTVNIIELGTDGCTLRTAEIASRRYEDLTLDITGRDPLLTIHTALPDDTVRDIWRITLTGRTEEAPDLRKLRQNLEEMFFSLTLRDRTEIPEELWTSSGVDTLRGLFLSKLNQLRETAQTDEEKCRIGQAVRWGLAALRTGEEVARHEDP